MGKMHQIELRYLGTKTGKRQEYLEATPDQNKGGKRNQPMCPANDNRLLVNSDYPSRGFAARWKVNCVFCYAFAHRL